MKSLSSIVLTIAALVPMSMLAHAVDYRCGQAAGCTYTYINPTTGQPTTATAPNGTVINTGAGYQVRSADGWNPVGG